MVRHTVLLSFLALALAGPASAQHEHHAAGQEALGSVDFPVTCNAEAQEIFQRGVAMLHSFWFETALGAFQRASEADPSCAMAHWGIAMTLWGNPMTRAAPPEERARAALAAAERARELAKSATPREQAYAEAVLALYRDQDRVDHITRMRAHEEAMRRVMEANPDDPEAAIFYGRIVVGNAPPDDLTFARQLHAATVMEPLFATRPDHPGLAHYLIHAFDAPAIADHGLEAAMRYADIAPSAPHALHMPSHIFTRLGYWHESIETNTRSAEAEPDRNGAVHPMDYMVYAYLQLGRDSDARREVERAVQNPDRFYGGLIGYNFAAMPARFALEREAWDEAAGLRVPVDALPYVEAVTRFARGIGAARSGRAAAAREEAAALASLRERLEEQREAYWATLVEAQRLAVGAWAARTDGKDAEALRLAGEAAALEETVEKHPVTPGPLLPARELEGDLLLELGRPADALRSYERTLEREPRRARALFGAARSAELAGETEVARARYQELLELMAEAEAHRPEPRAAREFLARR